MKNKLCLKGNKKISKKVNLIITFHDFNKFSDEVSKYQLVLVKHALINKLFITKMDYILSPCS